MNIYSNYGVNSYGYQNVKVQKGAQANASKPSFGSYMGHEDTERTPWGTTWGAERALHEEDMATKRMIQRNTLKDSDDPDVRAFADKVDTNPFWAEVLTQREFRKYHERVMAEREAEAAKLRAAAGIKNYDEKGGYDIKDDQGRVIEKGKGDEWTSRYEYDITYPVNRFGERYTMRGAYKIIKPDGSHVIMASPRSQTKLEQKYPNNSIEYIDNCSGGVMAVGLPDGRRFNTGDFLYERQALDSRKYFSRYDKENPLLEVFKDGSYKVA